MGGIRTQTTEWASKASFVDKTRLAGLKPFFQFRLPKIHLGGFGRQN